MKKDHFFGLDVMRFFSAVGVWFFHIAYWSKDKATTMSDGALLSGGRPSGFAALDYIAWPGWIGIEIFFVISGAVIFFSASSSRARFFLYNRALRVIPALWICTCISSIVLISFNIYPWSDLLIRFFRSLVVLPKGDWVAGCYWTLPVEFAFYGAVFLVLALRTSAALETLATFLCGWSAAYWLLKTTIGLPFGETTVSLSLMHDGCYFGLGMMLMIIANGGMTAKRIACVGLCVATAWWEIQSTAGPRVPDHADRSIPYFIWLLAVIVIGISVKRKFSLNFNAARFVTILGLITYPFYLIHEIVGATCLRFSALIGAWPSLIVAFIVPITIAYGVINLETSIRKIVRGMNWSMSLSKTS